MWNEFSSQNFWNKKKFWKHDFEIYTSRSVQYVINKLYFSKKRRKLSWLSFTFQQSNQNLQTPANLPTCFFRLLFNYKSKSDTNKIWHTILTAITLMCAKLKCVIITHIFYNFHKTILQNFRNYKISLFELDLNRHKNLQSPQFINKNLHLQLLLNI